MLRIIRKQFCILPYNVVLLIINVLLTLQNTSRILERMPIDGFWLRYNQNIFCSLLLYIRT